MKNYILTSKETGRQQYLNESQLNKLKAKQRVERTWTVEELPERKAVKKPPELTKKKEPKAETNE